MAAPPAAATATRRAATGRSYLKFREPAGRATGLYVPRAHAAEVRRAAAAWKALWETSVAVGALNRQAVRQRLRRKPGTAGGR